MFGAITPVVKNLLIINVGLFLIQTLLGVNFIELLGLRYIASEEFSPYQIFTHMFVHGSFLHLLGNMFGLFIFGPLLEKFWGGQRFLLFYLVTGLGASILYSGIQYFEIKPMEEAHQTYLSNPNPERFSTFVSEHAGYARSQLYDFINNYAENPDNDSYVEQSKEYVNQLYNRQANMPMVGASGAIFGILMAFGMLFPNTELMLLFFPFPIKAKYFVAIYGFFELYAGIQRAPGDNVAHFAHIGGMLFAYILIKIWQNKRNTFY